MVAAPPGPEDFERAEDAHSGSGVDETVEVGTYEADQQRTAQINEFNRQEFRKKLVYSIRTCFTITFAGIGWVFAVATAGATLFIASLLIAIVVAHYLIPQWYWLDHKELAVLGKWYTNSAQFIMPMALISNAWLVAYISIRRWRSTTTSGTQGG